jgi:tRNA pseudouridine38-40 synthase
VIQRNIKITLEYDGTAYSGWQTQGYKSQAPAVRQGSHKPTIQESIEKVLQKILQEKVHLIGSGRTDAGVHALAQVANFKTNSGILAQKLQRALNGLLPADISVLKIEEIKPDFHSRFSAKAKTYRYTILNRPQRSAFLRDRAYFYRYPLNFQLMQREAKALLGRHDFAAFCASGASAKDTRRTIRKIVLRKNGGLITIEIEADGFLYNMVRNIVGTLLEIGRGKFPAGSMRKILRLKNREAAGPTAPARGLVLVKVKY